MEKQDKVKLTLAVVLALAGVLAFYKVPAAQSYLQIPVLLLGIVLAVLLIVPTQPGRDFIGYARDSMAEGRKVVWPSRKEAIQMTGIVFVFVAVLALFMWLVDSGLTWLIYTVLLGQGG